MSRLDELMKDWGSQEYLDLMIYKSMILENIRFQAFAFFVYDKFTIQGLIYRYFNTVLRNTPGMGKDDAVKELIISIEKKQELNSRE